MGNPLTDMIERFDELYRGYEDVIDESTTGGSSFLSTNVAGGLKYVKEDVVKLLKTKTLDGTEGITDQTFLTLRTQIQTLGKELSKPKKQGLEEESLLRIIDDIYLKFSSLNDALVAAEAAKRNRAYRAAVSGFIARDINRTDTERDDLKAEFETELGSLPREAGPPTIGSLGFLKEKLELPDLASLINADHRVYGKLDGVRIKDHNIDRANLILEAFSSAWESVWSEGLANETSNFLKNSAKICIVLIVIKRWEIIDCFAHPKLIGRSLPFSKDDLKFMVPRDKDNFSIAQYIVAKREWKDRQHIQIDDFEPLPFELKRCGGGGYSTVYKAFDVFRNEKYVVKEPKNDKKAADQLKNERRLLEKLGWHEHIVQYAKSYERGGTHGLLLTPEATGDLSELLSKSSQDLDFLLKAFGCLSLALLWIHERRVRHKDIKPNNILYIKNKDPSQEDRFLWADFGNALEFGAESKTTTPFFHRVRDPDYAAPEVLALFFWPWRGRSSDVFSLGCVFIDILHVFINETSSDSMFRQPRSTNPRVPYSDNVKRIRTSIDRHKAGQIQDRIFLLLELSRKMIQKNQLKRPKMKDVVEKLRDGKGGQAYFCDLCFKKAQNLSS
ncbi:kinase-like protein [Acephala macrosclerotiorum]|nr:kinase-like protein [Acephala macrosclerotiorum]